MSNDNTTDNWFAICAVEDIPTFGSRKLHVGQITIALIRTTGEHVYALEDRCPHRGGPLSEGIVSADRVACPLHGQCIELATGRVAEPDSGVTATFAVRVVDGRVEMQRHELRAARAETTACSAAA
ncbi:MAG TPA: nitrite reductase small subunit NirD [Burkholderiaceae bacterium]|nr:nitrite reductase small subunit NirD [Burkholderiaceae bacterium]